MRSRPRILRSPMLNETPDYQRLTLESWFTNLEQTPMNRSQKLARTTNYERMTGKLKI